MDDEFSLQAPSASYALESSSGESDWDTEDELAPHPRKIRTPAQEPNVEIDGQVMKGSDVIFLIGEAGENMARGIVGRGQGDASQVLVNGEQMASIDAKAGQTTLVFVSQELPLVLLYPLGQKLLEALAPSSTVIISSYHMPTYISMIRSDSPRVLYLRSQPSPRLDSLAKDGSLSPFEPPNLLRGLPSLLLTLSALSSTPSTLILLPTVTLPSPLNGPFTRQSSNTFYDAGPTSLSDPGGVFQEIRGKLQRVANELGWSEFWSAVEMSGSGFSWLEKARKQRRQELANSMYM